MAAGRTLRKPVHTYLDKTEHKWFTTLREEDNRSVADFLRQLIRAEAKRRNLIPKKALAHGRLARKGSTR